MPDEEAVGASQALGVYGRRIPPDVHVEIELMAEDFPLKGPAVVIAGVGRVDGGPHGAAALATSTAKA